MGCGSAFCILDRGVFNLQLGPVTFNHKVAVAEIEDNCLLSFDVLYESNPKMDILHSEGIIKFGEHTIPIHSIMTSSRAMRVSTVNSELIPGMTEKVINVFVHRPKGYVASEKNMLIECDPQFSEKYGCMVPYVMVNTKGKVAVPVRVFNLDCLPVMIEVFASDDTSRECSWNTGICKSGRSVDTETISRR